jgi:lipoprotein-releasing system permease protein
MKFELTLAWRFLREGRFQSALIVIGVAVGVAVVIYISALILGLQANTVNRTLGAQAHIVIKPPDEVVRNVLPTDTTLATIQPKAQRLRSVDNWQVLMPIARSFYSVLSLISTTASLNFQPNSHAAIFD